MRNFGGIEDRYANYDHARILLQSIPYDGTSTWGKGADKAFPALLEAAENMELYDIETNFEVYKKGIHILPEMNLENSPEKMYKAIHDRTKELLESGKFLTFFGGEHSISIGIIKSYYEKYTDLTVLHLDAHADLRPEYLGSPYNHACAMHDASKHTNLIQVGIRSMAASELQYLNKDKCFFAQDMVENSDWMQKSIDLMGQDVYITLDLDVLDPSIMPATGTPEPGGMDWYALIGLLKKVFKSRNVVGFDIVELAPIALRKDPDFLAAKLYYKILSYKYFK